jgi:hypothetical protein
MPTDPLEQFWSAVLSRQPQRIRRAVRPLNAAARRALLEHLERMIREEGWLPQQRDSAQTAREIILALDSPQEKSES